jgi:hypothetical protein
MTPNSIAVALFAAFCVGGILNEIAPLWAVVLVGLALGAAAFVVMDRYPGIRKGRTRPADTSTPTASHQQEPHQQEPHQQD